MGSRGSGANRDMKMIVQPNEGITPLLTAVKRAKRTLDIVIFRFDLEELEDALAAAVTRGVVVRALIAHTNKGGEGTLRKLEQHMLKQGVTVCRTNDDMVRYHGKLMIVDGRAAYVLGFNFTSADLKSRSFGVIVKSRRIVKELTRLFESDANRTDYTPRVRDLVISPENARSRLQSFLQKARVSLDIYDPNASDDGMLALLAKKAARGVRIRILGSLEEKWMKSGFYVKPYPGKRLHVRAIVRDGRRAFIGSQSLRKLELDNRREVGVVIRERKAVRRVERVFREDWKLATQPKKKS
jgi:phosphatidylserine/phosphatidylglycerophosphate/cardiolipin synthase-like enzyme